jgi:hypothetical protein
LNAVDVADQCIGPGRGSEQRCGEREERLTHAAA